MCQGMRLARCLTTLLLNFERCSLGNIQEDGVGEGEVGSRLRSSLVLVRSAEDVWSVILVSLSVGFCWIFVHSFTHGLRGRWIVRAEGG